MRQVTGWKHGNYGDYNLQFWRQDKEAIEAWWMVKTERKQDRDRRKVEREIGNMTATEW